LTIFRVVLDVGGLRHAVDQRGHVRRPAHRVEFAGSSQLVFQRDEVHRHPPLGELDDLLENPAVGIPVEVLMAYQLHGDVVGVVLDQDRAQDRALGLEIVRQRPFGGDRRVSGNALQSAWSQVQLRER
jgi:hypothetical protein